MKEINLHSRYNRKNKLIQVSDKEYKLEVEIPYVRCGIIQEDKSKYSFVDPEGGPFITPGYEIEGNIVKEIKQTYNGIVIEFE